MKVWEGRTSFPRARYRLPVRARSCVSVSIEHWLRYFRCRRMVFCRKHSMMVSSNATAVLTYSCHFEPQPSIGPTASQAMTPPEQAHSEHYLMESQRIT